MVSCQDNRNAPKCVCIANNTLNPASSTAFIASCTDQSGTATNLNYTDAETDVYNLTATPPPTTTTYSIKEGNQGAKVPGVVFPITIVNSSNATVTPTTAASLDAYNSSDAAVSNAIAKWTTTAGASIYDVAVAANTPAAFNVFLLRNTTGVAKIGGTVDGTATDKVTLTAGSYPNPSDLVVANRGANEIVFILTGAARTAINTAKGVGNYVVVNTNGNVQSSGKLAATDGNDLGASIGYIVQKAGSCTVNGYVLMRIGTKTSKVYLPKCLSVLP